MYITIHNQCYDIFPTSGFGWICFPSKNDVAKFFCMHLFSTSMSVLHRLNNYYFRKCTLHIRVCLLLKEVLRRWHNCYRHIHTTFIKIYTKTLKGPTTILPSSTLYMFSECLHKRIPLNYELRVFERVLHCLPFIIPKLSRHSFHQHH